MASQPTRKHIRPEDLHSKCPTFKAGYTTRDEALDACERSMDAGLVSPGCHLTPYPCDRCSEWHITNRRIVFAEAPEDLSRHDHRHR